ncbi:MAG TPA: hypothetical protein VHE99_07885 [Gammaproteobacteria bacterium]|nr:hypothetical protein [Gammaproteobacteria bacterium]
MIILSEEKLEMVVGGLLPMRRSSSTKIITKGFTKGIQLQPGETQALANAVASTGGGAYASAKIVVGLGSSTEV